LKVYINTDGAVGPPNPGPAGAGYVIVFEGDDGPESVVGAVPLTECNHHEAEYHAAIHALRRAAELGATEVVLRSDSMVLVDQMNDEARVRVPEIARLADQLHREIAKYHAVEIVWVRRKENKAADLLSKVGLSKAEPVDGVQEELALAGGANGKASAPLPGLGPSAEQLATG
jgi:ribonuclease HI